MVYLSFEALVSLFRIPYVYYVARLNVVEYLGDSLFRVLPLIVVQTVVSLGMSYVFSSEWRFLFSLPVSFLVGLLFAWTVVLTVKERTQVASIFKKNKP